MKEACLIARHLPGLGNPWKLTYGQWVLALVRLEEILLEEAPTDEDGTHGANLRLMKRRGDREKLYHARRRSQVR